MYDYTRLNCSQEFKCNPTMNTSGYGESYSLEEYRQRFTTYYGTVMAELNNAKASYDTALAAYDRAVENAGSILENWQANIAAKEADLNNAASALEAAQNEAARLQEELEVVTDVYDEAEKIYANLQDELFRAEADMDAKQTAYEDALNYVIEEFGETVIKANRALWDAEAKYDEALASQAEAEVSFEQAQDALNEATDAKEAADKNLKMKTGILLVKNQALTDAKNAYYLTVANLAIAQADYERFKPSSVENSDMKDSKDIIQANAPESIYSDTFCYSIENNKRIAVFPANCSFRFFLNSLESLIKGCSSDNLVIDCSATSWFSMHEKVLKALKNNPDISLTVRFRYKGKKYIFTIPAGYNLERLQASNGWYGFMYLNMVFGGHEIVSDNIL